MEDDLDEIAGRRKDRLTYLDEFWNGNGSPGLDMLRNEALKAADPVSINAVVTFEVDGERIELRNGKFGPFLKRGDETRSIPDDLPLDELTAEVAVALLDAPKGDEPIGDRPGDRPPGVRQERPLRSLRAARHGRRAAARARRSRRWPRCSRT